MLFNVLRKKFQAHYWIVILAVAFLVRFYHLSWGEGYFFHPDENNMARSISQMSLSNLDPNFYAYGQFPLYLTYFSAIFFKLINYQNLVISSFEAAYILRFWSAVFSVLTVVVGFKLSSSLFPKDKKYIFPALLALSPGLIQSAHFGTTESILTLIFVSLAWLCLRLIKQNKTKDFFLTGLVAGVGLASKLSALVYILPLFLVTALILFFKKPKNYCKNFIVLVFAVITFSILFCPYFVINWPEALSTLKYESQVARGEVVVFYTRQFANTVPVIFQFKNIFPWVLGPPLFLTFLAGLVLAVKKLFKEKRLSVNLIIILSGSVSWFVFNSFLFAKWTRFMIPVLPFFVLLATWFLAQLKTKKVKRIWLLLCFIPGLVLTKVYSHDSRLEATSWLNSNISSDAVVLSEGGNVVNLPVENKTGFKVVNFDFYTLEDDLGKIEELNSLISEADYILVPSRRVFANLSKEEKYPVTTRYYRSLFSGELGFVKEKEFKPFSFWEELIVGSDLNSEETWTVFDRPVIRLYKRESV
jgi:4-amino-4-deoxy-L-arabinose transferase-like glycosyltransferase